MKMDVGVYLVGGAILTTIVVVAGVVWALGRDARWPSEATFGSHMELGEIPGVWGQDGVAKLTVMSADCAAGEEGTATLYLPNTRFLCTVTLENGWTRKRVVVHVLPDRQLSMRNPSPRFLPDLLQQ